MTDILKLHNLLQVLSGSSELSIKALTFAVYMTVKKNPSVTESKLIWNLVKQFDCKPEIIQTALTSLKGKEYLNALKTWNVGNACHLHVIPEWLESSTAQQILLEQPYLAQFMAPSIPTADKKTRA
jgi:hypothetical protein